MPKTTDEPDELLVALQIVDQGIISREHLATAVRQWRDSTDKRLEDAICETATLPGSVDAIHTAFGSAETKVDINIAETVPFTADATPPINDPFATSQSAGGAIARAEASTAKDEDAFATTRKGSDARAEDIAPRPNALDAFATMAPDPTAVCHLNVNNKGGEQGRFIIKSAHARGGLGVVYIANDLQLNRDVALKQMRSDRANDAEYRDKFYLEAEVTGQLEHPGIVPVYSLGIDDQSSPYYAMRFIQGRTFHEAIKDFHSEANASKDYSGLAFRQILRRFVDACNAIDYAHSRCILHRDIKPANIMIGQHGETLVVDWGLAKSIQRNSSDAETTGSDSIVRNQEPIQLRSGSQGTATMIGAFSGTIPYASPEQLQGRIDLLGPESDVYSLGCMLFEILVNRPPINERIAPRKAAELIEGGQLPTVRSLIPSVPRALEAICNKAMAIDMTARYSSAKELADDIERWLADERIEAFGNQEPLSDKTWRLLRRYRNWTFSIGAALAAIAAIALVSSLIINQARLREGQAKSEAVQYKSDAVTRYSVARDAIDSMLIQGTEYLADFPATKDLQQRMLQLAADDYQRLSDNTSQDPQLELERVRALVRLADILHSQAQYDKAHVKFQEALSALKQLQKAPALQDQDLLPDVEVEIANVTTREAQAWSIEDQYSKANELFTAAIDQLRQLKERFPDSKTVKRKLATSLMLKGNQEAIIGEASLAAIMLEESLSTLKAPGVIESVKDRLLYLTLCESLGRTWSRLGRHNQAISLLDEAAAYARQSALANPTNPDCGKAWASVCISQANEARTLGDYALSLERLEQALAIYQQLREQWPDNLQFEEYSALTSTDIGLLLLDQRRTADAGKFLDIAEAIYQRLAATYPDVIRYQQGLATTLDGLGQFHMASPDRADEAQQSFNRAREILERLARASDDAKPYLVQYAVATSHSARLLHFRQDPDNAREQFQQSRKLLSQIVEAFPDEPNHSHLLAHVEWNFANFEWAQSKVDTANELFHSSMSIRKKLAEEHLNAEYSYWVAYSFAFCANRDLRDRKVAQEFTEKALLQSGVHLSRDLRFLSIYLEADKGNVQLAIAKLATLRRDYPTADAREFALTALLNSLKKEHAEAAANLESARKNLSENAPNDLDVLQFVKEMSERVALRHD